MRGLHVHAVASSIAAGALAYLARIMLCLPIVDPCAVANSVGQGAASTQNKGEKYHGFDLADCASPSADRRDSYVGSQQKLGLWAQRYLGCDTGHRSNNAAFGLYSSRILITGFVSWDVSALVVYTVRRGRSEVERPCSGQGYICARTGVFDVAPPDGCAWVFRCCAWVIRCHGLTTNRTGSDRAIVYRFYSLRRWHWLGQS